MQSKHKDLNLFETWKIDKGQGQMIFKVIQKNNK